MNDLFTQLEAIEKNYASRQLPLDEWNPPLSGDIDILIQRDGRWFHEGDEIRRVELVKLFASVLKREGDDYFLVTPVEKWRIRVEDLPFVVVDFDRRGSGQAQMLAFKTSTDEVVIAGPDHPLRVESHPLPDGGEEPAPSIRIRNNLDGRISRNVFYHLVDLALENNSEGPVTIMSQGTAFSLTP